MAEIDIAQELQRTRLTRTERSSAVIVIVSVSQTIPLLCGHLRLAGFEPVWFDRYDKALNALESGGLSPPDAMIVDVSSPYGEGLEACQKLRDYCSAPIVVLSSGYSEANVVAALGSGADEYLAKPIRNGELVARLHAMLRRSRLNGDRPGDPLLVGDLEISLAHHVVMKNGRKVDLSPLEFRLLVCLAREPGTLLSHRTLMARVWGAEYVESRHYLRLYIRYLREKLEDDPSDPKLILSEWGMGYRLQVPSH